MNAVCFTRFKQDDIKCRASLVALLLCLRKIVSFFLFFCTVSLFRFHPTFTVFSLSIYQFHLLLASILNSLAFWPVASLDNRTTLGVLYRLGLKTKLKKINAVLKCGDSMHVLMK